MGKKEPHSSNKNLHQVREQRLPLEELRTEADFLKYMKLLKEFAKKYCVMIVVNDTPVGPATTHEMTSALMRIGLRTDLYAKYRCAYAALIDAGQIVFEELRPDRVETNVIIGQSAAELVSMGFNTGDRKGLIRIDGKDYSPNRRGLNIVVYDKTAREVLDTASFDTYAEAVPRFFIDMGVLGADNSSERPAVQSRQDDHNSENLSGDDLTREHDFANYLRLLKKYANRYCILVNSRDTPWGPGFTEEISKLYMAVGFKINLIGKFRCAYAAVIDAGELVYEELCEDATQYIDVTLTSEPSEPDDFKATIISKGYYTGRAGEKTPIEINGKDYSLGCRGLNFVVYDKAAKTAVDIVNFDTYSDMIPCYRYQERVQSWNEYITSHPGVSVIGFNFPSFPPDEYLTPRERFTKENHVSFGTILNNLDKHIFTLNQYFDEAGITEVLKVPKSYHDIYGVRRFEDICGKHVNIIDGHRVTAHQPKQNLNETVRHIYLIGGCGTFGVGADDSRTVASWLQALLNAHVTGQKIVVENYGFYLAETDGRGDERLAILQSLPVKPGDIMLCDVCYDFPLIDTSKTAMKPRDFDVFIDHGHLTPGGYRLVAEKIFEDLKEMGLLDKAGSGITADVDRPAAERVQKERPFGENTNKELDEYKKTLTDWYKQTFSPTIGSVVMNCNPFTLGHRYLVEKALTQCDFLIIFVVQEDKSRFPFEDRLQLVKEGVADLKNVSVLPSGRFVLSSLTFSEYFNKSELQDRTIDTSLDVTVFAREIAPCLHITKRFAGEEPFDAVTRQYNETMRRILPEYGIEFVEVPRTTDVQEGTIISASRVRDLLEKREFDAIRPLVPESTFQYLKGL